MKRRSDSQVYEWWYIVGALYFIQKMYITWANNFLLGIDDEKELSKFKTSIKNFSIVSLVFSGFTGKGFTIHQIKEVFINFCTMYKELGSHINQNPKLFLESSSFRKIFNFKTYESSGGIYILFAKTVETHKSKGWLKEPECKYFQEGLRSLFHRENSSMDILNEYFNNLLKNFDTKSFTNVSDFALWWIDKRWEQLHLSVGHRVYDQLFVHGKTSYEKKKENTNTSGISRKEKVKLKKKNYQKRKKLQFSEKKESFEIQSTAGS